HRSSRPRNHALRRPSRCRPARNWHARRRLFPGRGCGLNRRAPYEALWAARADGQAVGPRALSAVLVPVDFSTWSADAVMLAQRIAPGATLVLMHAVEVPFEGPAANRRRGRGRDCALH